MIKTKLTKKQLKFIAWMTWTASRGPGSIGERGFVMQKLNSGLTKDEQQQVADLMPFDEYETVRKPRTKVRRDKTVKRKALPAPLVIEGRE